MACLALACTLAAGAPACQAQSATHLDKQGRKIHNKLAKYKPGSYLEFIFRDHTDSFGNLGALSATSFTFTNSDTNAKETHLYSEVARAGKGKTYIGEGTAPRHHILFF
jgi:hypothetical protein